MVAYLYKEAKRGNWLAGFTLLLTVSCVVAVLGLTFYIIDSSFIETKDKYAVIVGKHHSPGHMQHQVISTGKTTMINMIWIPDSWSLHVDVLGQDLYCPVTNSQYTEASFGDNVTVHLGVGRLSGSTHCKGASGI